MRAWRGQKLVHFPQRIHESRSTVGASYSYLQFELYLITLIIRIMCSIGTRIQSITWFWNTVGIRTITYIRIIIGIWFFTFWILWLSFGVTIYDSFAIFPFIGILFLSLFFTRFCYLYLFVSAMISFTDLCSHSSLLIFSALSA